ncbi:MAG: hypothetical protein ACRC0A_01570 [Chitinophagaceae bacterium]
MLVENNFDLTQTLKNDGTINFIQINKTFPSLSLSDMDIVENESGDYLIIKLGVDFITTFNQAPVPSFLLNGILIQFIPKNNISLIAPQQGTVEFLLDPSGYPAYSSSIFMSLQDIGKSLNVTVYSAQSVLEAWSMNEIAKKLNQLEPTTINDKLGAIVDNGNNTYDGNFENLKPIKVDSFTDIFELELKGLDVIENPIHTAVITSKTQDTEQYITAHANNGNIDKGTVVTANAINNDVFDISSFNGNALGISSENILYTENGKVLRFGVLEIPYLDFTGKNNNDPVYIEQTGLLTFNNTKIKGGYIFDTTNKLIYFDVGCTYITILDHIRKTLYFGNGNKFVDTIIGIIGNVTIPNTGIQVSTDGLLAGLSFNIGDVINFNMYLKSSVGMNGISIEIMYNGTIVGKNNIVLELDTNYEYFDNYVIIKEDITVLATDTVDVIIKSKHDPIEIRVNDDTINGALYINLIQ